MKPNSPENQNRDVERRSGDPKPNTPASESLKEMKEAGDKKISKEFYGDEDEFPWKIEFLLEIDKLKNEFIRLKTLEKTLLNAYVISRAINLEDFLSELKSIASDKDLVSKSKPEFKTEDINECITYIHHLLEHKLDTKSLPYEVIRLISYDIGEIQRKIAKYSRELNNSNNK